MFERYTELARRTIFFARYEASVYGSAYISSEHLLLGLLREDKMLAARLPLAKAKKEIESRLTGPIEKIPTSVDLPLDEEAKRVLHYAAAEAKELEDPHIDTAHLALGLLRVETSFAAEIMRRSGLDAPAVRLLRRPPPSPPAGLEEFRQRPLIVAAPALDALLHSYRNLVQGAVPHLEALWDNAAEKPLAQRSWSRKEALGHLIDLATAHHQWFVRALLDPKLTAAGYPDEDWVRQEGYAEQPWTDLVETWVALNNLLIHVLTRVPEKKLEMPCRVGIADPISLFQLIQAYVDRTTDLLGEILARR